MSFASRVGGIAGLALAVMLVGCNGGQPSPLTDQLYVANLGNSIAVFDIDSDGTLAEPAAREIRGPATGLHSPMAVAVMRGGEIYVANLGDPSSPGPSVTVYAPGADGNAAPVRTVRGAQTGMTNPNGISVGSWPGLLVTNYVPAPGSPQAVQGVIELSLDPANDQPTGGVFGSRTTIAGPQGIGRDEQNRVFIAEPASNRILGFQLRGNTTHNEAPDFVLAGSDTLLDHPVGVDFDSQDNMYVANRGNSSITVYPPGQFGNVAPDRRIGGPGAPSTLLYEPDAIAVDDLGRIYVSQTNVVLVFAAGANGTDEPLQRLGKEETVLSGTMGLAIR